LRARRRLFAFSVLPTALALVAGVASGTPSGTGADSENDIRRFEVEIVLVGRAAQTPTLEQSIDALAQSEGLTPRFVHLAELPRQELADVATRPTPGRVRVWIDLPQPNRALLLISEPTGQNYIVRELPLSNNLDEVDREQIAQVVQSSTLALLRGDRSLDRASMQRALGVTPTPAVPPTPVPEEAHAEPAPTSFGRLTLGPCYSWAWTGAQLEERHALGLLFGMTEIADSNWSLTMAVYAGLPQQHRTSLVGLKTRESSLYLLLGRAWSLSERFDVRGSLGPGLMDTQATPLPSKDDSVQLRGSTTHFRPSLRAELGVELTLSSFVLTLGPTADVHLERTHYDVRRAGQRLRAITPWMVVPGGQLTVGYRQPTSIAHKPGASGGHLER
jgi:hypothetical protein